MPLSYQHWISQTKTPELPILAFGGDEKAFIEEALKNIRAKVVTGPCADLNHIKCSAKQKTIVQILDEAWQLPMMAKHKLIEVHEASALAGEQASLLESYIKNPSSTSFIVLIFDSLDFRQKIQKILEQAGIFYRFDHPKSYEMPKLIEQKAAALKLKPSPKAIQLLHVLVGTDVGFLNNALEKLALALESKTIEPKDIETHVAGFGIEDAFLLGRALLIHDTQKAFQVLRNLQNCREVPIKILGLIAWHVRQNLNVKLALLNKQNEHQIGQSLGLFGDRLKFFIQAAQQMPLHQIEKQIEQLAILDRKLKLSSPSLGWLYLEDLVYNFTSSGTH